MRCQRPLDLHHRFHVRVEQVNSTVVEPVRGHKRTEPKNLLTDSAAIDDSNRTLGSCAPELITRESGVCCWVALLACGCCAPASRISMKSSLRTMKQIVSFVPLSRRWRRRGYEKPLVLGT